MRLFAANCRRFQLAASSVRVSLDHHSRTCQGLRNHFEDSRHGNSTCFLIKLAQTTAASTQNPFRKVLLAIFPAPSINPAQFP
jgi:hypothetical protein